MAKFKIGDIVVCQPGFIGHGYYAHAAVNYGGAGYVENQNFIIKSIDERKGKGESIYFPGPDSGQGVYEKALTLLEKSEKEMNSSTTTTSGAMIQSPKIEIEIGDKVQIKLSKVILFSDYRTAPATVYSITPGAFNPIAIQYDDTGLTSSVSPENLDLISKAKEEIPAETNPLNIEGLTLLCDIYIQNESTNEKILALLQKIVDQKKDKKPDEKEEEKKEDSDPKEQPQDSEREEEPGEEESSEQESSEKSKEAQKKGGSKKQSKHKKEKSLKSSGEERPEETDGDTSPGMKLIKEILHAASQKEKTGGEKLAEALKEMETEEHDAIPDGEHESGGDIPVDRISADKVYCSVCRRYHTKGTHD